MEKPQLHFKIQSGELSVCILVARFLQLFHPERERCVFPFWAVLHLPEDTNEDSISSVYCGEKNQSEENTTKTNSDAALTMLSCLFLQWERDTFIRLDCPGN